MVGGWEIVLSERTCGGEADSTGGRCLEHQGGGEKERIEEGLKERKETRDGQRLASCGRNREERK